MSKKLGVFLLSYKRPEFILEAINSILAQDYNQFDLIISENSPDDSVVKQLDMYLADPRIQLIKRNPSLTSLAHFNKVLSEAKEYEYIMLFHDDDVLIPNALATMVQTLENNFSAVAAACNAFIIKNREYTNTLLSPNIKNNIEIKTQSELINRYIFRNPGTMAFPSYIYRTKFLENIQLDAADGGKYSDVSFLVKLLNCGHFIWHSEPLMRYRQHPGNDTASLNMKDILSLCLFLFKTSPQMIAQIIFYYSKQLVKKIYFFFIKK